MPDVLLATLNARYIHAAFGLRYLMANLGPLHERARLMEFDLQARPLDIAETLLAASPKIIGLGVYIWNAAPMLELVALLKKIRPDIVVILGGPEVSYETGQQEIAALADYVITGEADLKFAEICAAILEGNPPAQKVIPAELPDLARLALPYQLYTDEDVAHRMIYVEASRGCPFTCEFCLSSLDVPVRSFPLAPFLEALEQLLARGVRQFKFVDRTFNLNLRTSQAILDFFRARYCPGLFVHFEMIPDRLPESLRQAIAQFPPGALQFEVGVQTFNEETARRIRRRQDYSKLADNFKFLREQTGVYVHADLIAGLPGEDWASFAAGFDQLVRLRPHEIQVGLLKRLRGAPISRHDQAEGMVYSPQPPYEVLQTRSVPFQMMQRLRRFSRFWDLIGNSGNFLESTPLLWTNASSPADAFLAWSDWAFARLGRTHQIALPELVEILFAYLAGELGLDKESVARTLWRDYQRGGRKEVPAALKPFVIADAPRLARARPRAAPKRQARVMAGVAGPARL